MAAAPAPALRRRRGGRGGGGAPPIECEVVHHIEGRVRLRMPLLRRDPSFAERAIAFLERQNGVRSARASAVSASMVVLYDPDRVTVVRLIAWLQREVPAPAGRTSRTTARPVLGPLVCGGLALGLSLLGAPLAITVALGAVSAIPIFARAVRSLVAERRISVDALDATAVAVLALRGNLFTASLTVSLIAGGEYIRSLTARRSRRALVGLLATSDAFAWVVRGRLKERLPAEALAAGDTVVVYPGELVLVDGVVIRGRALVDQKVLTGEATPMLKQPGDAVYAATVLTDGKLYVRTERTGAETRAQRIVQILEGAPHHDTRIANHARRLADRFVLPTLALATAVYLATGDVARAVSVLVFDFATGVRVSVPTTVLASMSAGVRRDVLIKGGRAMEQLARIDTLVFDKTGTLTAGRPRVVEVHSLVPELREDEVLSLAAAVERRLRHPAAEAIVRAAERRGLSVPERESSHFSVGLGVEAVVEGRGVLVGDQRFLERKRVPLPERALALANAAGSGGASSAFVAHDGRLIGLIAYADTARAEASAVIERLRDRGVRRLLMVTGDNERAAWYVARQVGIERVEANVFPERKAEIVRELQAAGHVVGVIGDGINDSPALAHADVSFSLKAGSDVAKETADIVLHGDLHGLPESIDVARESLRLIRQNLALVAVPNVVGLALASVGLIGPAVSTAINNGSTVVAGLNGLRPLLAAGPASDKSDEARSLPAAAPSIAGVSTTIRPVRAPVG